MKKMNQEIYNKLNFPDIVTLIKVQRLEWSGHVVRMDGGMAMKTLLEGKLEKVENKECVD